MLLLGLSPKMANTIVNYRNKGGKFYQADSFKKMYGLSNEQYQQLRPYIQIQAFGKTKTTYATNSFKEEKVSLQLAPFNPNTATEKTLRQLGLSKKATKILLKFRAKGGQFYKKEDLKKIYGVTETQYQQLEAYIEIPKRAIVQNNTPTTYNNSSNRIEPASENFKKPPTIDINKATADEWQSLYGIGPSYAKRITNFRDKLGGFNSIQQVAETYGIPDSTFQKIKPFLTASPIFQKIPLNSSDYKMLSNHPYIKSQLAKTIIAYRKQHGPFKNIEGLKEIVILKEETFAKISPYLSID